MNRREMVLAALTATSAAVASQVLAADSGAEHRQHGESSPAGGHSPRPELMRAAADCEQTGQICLRHCLDLFASGGHKEMAACAIAVSDMIAVCATLHQLAASSSRHLPAMAKVALEVCDACEEACRKHESHHTQCRDCADACVACAKECKRLLG